MMAAYRTDLRFNLTAESRQEAGAAVTDLIELAKQCGFALEGLHIAWRGEGVRGRGARVTASSPVSERIGSFAVLPAGADAIKDDILSCQLPALP
jgi:hypothetical protein